MKLKSVKQRAVTAGVAAVLLCGCGGGAKRVETGTPRTLGADDEPKFVIDRFEVLPAATDAPVLPVLRKNGVSTEECFEAVKKPSVWESGAAQVAELYRRNGSAVTSSILTELTALFPNERDLFADPAQWTVIVDRPVIRHVFPTQIRLTDKPGCRGADHTFPEGARTVTTAFGAKEIRFVSSRPIPGSRIRTLRKEAVRRKMRLVAVDAYAPAEDENGKPIRGPKNEKLYNSPSGALIRAKELPLPKEREVVEWKLIRPEPVFFALGDLPADSWRASGPEARCEVFLVNYDATPRPVADCPDLAAYGFGTEPGKEAGTVQLKVASADETFVKEAPLGALTDIAAGRALLRVVPHPVEEGTRLEIRYMVLATDDAVAVPDTFPTVGLEKSGRKKKRR